MGPVHEEHVNAGRTVQQLCCNIGGVEKLCFKVQKGDLRLLKRMIDSVENASAATAGFFQLHLASVEELKKQFNGSKTIFIPSDSLKQSLREGREKEMNQMPTVKKSVQLTVL